MADPVLELDAAASNVDGTNPGTSMLLVDSSTGWGLSTFEAPSPEPKLLWTSNVDMDGAIRADPGNYENRTVTAQLWCERSTAALTQAQLRILGHKIGKIAREGGTLKVTYPSGNTFIFDLVAGSHNIVFDHAFVMGNLASVTVTFTALPGARGAEQDLGDNTETTLPALVFTEASVPGDLDALGRLVVDNDDTAAQQWLMWGIQSRYYSSSANAALFYEAEARTALGGSATATSASGAISGGSPNVMRNTDLLTEHQAIMSTQASGAGAHLSHVGTFRVYARVMSWNTNTGTVTVAWEWGEGDYLRSTVQNEQAIDPTLEQKWLLLDMGLVTLRPVSQGTQRWEGRVLAKSTVIGDQLDVDYLMFVPIAEGSGIARGVSRDVTPTSYVGRDDFTGTAAAGALNARVAPAGGTWATSGVATDFAFYDTDADGNAGEGVQRSTASDASARFAILGSTNYTDTAVSVLTQYASMSTGSLHMGAIARWTDSSNYLVADFIRSTSGSTKTLEIRSVVGGTPSTFASSTDWPVGIASSLSYWKLLFTVDSQGLAVAKVISMGQAGGAAAAPPAGTVMMQVSYQEGVWSSGGTLGTGKPGIYDLNSGPSATRRDYDDFFVWVPPPDAAVFGSQSLEVRHDRVTREDSGGTIWSSVSSYEGDYLNVPPSGAEARTLRAIVKVTRGDPSTHDHAIDNISARLYVTPRYLQVPSA